MGSFIMTASLFSSPIIGIIIGLIVAISIKKSLKKIDIYEI
jgi:predicted membrane protein